MNDVSWKVVELRAGAVRIELHRKIPDGVSVVFVDLNPDEALVWAELLRSAALAVKSRG